MVAYLLILILLALVLGPLGLAAGLGVGMVVLVVVAVLAVAGLVLRGLMATGKAIGGTRPEQLPGQPLGDHVRQDADGWYAIVGPHHIGPWSDRLTAENILIVEQRKRGA